MAKIFIKQRFGTTPNELLYNKEITLKAKGLYGYIQAKPDDWNFSAQKISNECKESIDSIRLALKELEEFGYLVRKKHQNQKGHWEIDYILLSEPELKIPALENPTSEIPALENTPNNKRKNLQKKNNNNTNENAEIFPRLIPINEKFGKLTFSKIKNFSEFYNEFEYNRKYLRLAYRFWKLWHIENPNNKTTKDAQLVRWYDAIRLIIEVDKQSIERLIGVYKYFEKCADGEKGFDKWWFNKIKSVGALRAVNNNGEYTLDKLADIINDKIQKDDNFSKTVNKSIDNFNL